MALKVSPGQPLVMVAMRTVGILVAKVVPVPQLPTNVTSQEMPLGDELTTSGCVPLGRHQRDVQQEVVLPLMEVLQMQGVCQNGLPLWASLERAPELQLQTFKKSAPEAVPKGAAQYVVWQVKAPQVQPVPKYSKVPQDRLGHTISHWRHSLAPDPLYREESTNLLLLVAR